MEAAEVIQMPDAGAHGHRVTDLIREHDDGDDLKAIAAKVLSELSESEIEAAALRWLQELVLMIRGRDRRSAVERVKRGPSRADVIAGNVEEFELFSMMVAVRGEFSQPFGDCTSQHVFALVGYYTDLEASAAAEKASYGRVLALFDAHPKAKRVRDLPYGEVERAMCDA
jgi:hypothetical protein